MGARITFPNKIFCTLFQRIYVCLLIHTTNRIPVEVPDPPQKLALEPLSPPMLVSSSTSLLGAFPFLAAFKIGFFKVFFTTSSC